MKKFIFVLGLLLFSVVIFAGAWKNTEKFIEYKKHKSIAKQAEAEGNFDVAIKEYLICVELAKNFSTPEITAWCLNNVSFCLISKHKLTKKIELLKQALEYLAEAQQMGVEAVMPKILNNISYCEYWFMYEEKRKETIKYK